MNKHFHSIPWYPLVCSAWDGEEGEERMEDLTGLKQQVREPAAHSPL